MAMAVRKASSGGAGFVGSRLSKISPRMRCRSASFIWSPISFASASAWSAGLRLRPRFPSRLRSRQASLGGAVCQACYPARYMPSVPGEALECRSQGRQAGRAPSPNRHHLGQIVGKPKSLTEFDEGLRRAQGCFGVPASHFENRLECPGVGYSRSMASFDGPRDGFVA